MNHEEFATAADEGQLILYRATFKNDFESDYYDSGPEDILETVRERNSIGSKT